MRDGWMPMPDRPPKTGKRGRRDLEHFHKCCSATDSGVREAVFLTFDFVSAQSQGWQTCSFAEASSKVKNPRSVALHHFCQCSKHRYCSLPILNPRTGPLEAKCDLKPGINPICIQVLSGPQDYRQHPV